MQLIRRRAQDDRVSAPTTLPIMTPTFANATSMRTSPITYSKPTFANANDLADDETEKKTSK